MFILIISYIYLIIGKYRNIYILVEYLTCILNKGCEKNMKFVSFNSARNYLKDNATVRISEEAAEMLRAELEMYCQERAKKIVKVAQEALEPGVCTLWGRHILIAKKTLAMAYDEIKDYFRNYIGEKNDSN